MIAVGVKNKMKEKRCREIYEEVTEQCQNKSELSACAVWSIPVAELREYAIWGGVSRYWELRRDYPDKETAIRKVLLDPQGPLIEEPQRLLRDDMRDMVQASTLLTIIGNGDNKLSEIATRAGKDSNTISEPLSKLRDLD